jgi:hypothetical protein
MKRDFTWGASAGKTRLNSYPELVDLFQELERRFDKALREDPISELEKSLNDGVVITVSFRKAVKK